MVMPFKKNAITEKPWINFYEFFNLHTWQRVGNNG